MSLYQYNLGIEEDRIDYNSKILDIAGKSSEIDRAAFTKIRKEFWKKVGELLQKGKI